MMEPTNNEKIFNDKIDSRLKSVEWDHGIARNVLHRRRRKQYILGATGSFGSMAAAVLIALFLAGAPGRTPSGEGLNSFVNAQVEGTWKKVFDGSQVRENGETVFMDIRDDASVDAMIDETLAERL